MALTCICGAAALTAAPPEATHAILIHFDCQPQATMSCKNLLCKSYGTTLLPTLLRVCNSNHIQPHVSLEPSRLQLGKQQAHTHTCFFRSQQASTGQTQPHIITCFIGGKSNHIQPHASCGTQQTSIGAATSNHHCLHCCSATRCQHRCPQNCSASRSHHH